MTIVYVATSKALSEWSHDVGLTKHVYKVGIADDGTDDVAKLLNDEAFAGHADWRLLSQQTVEELDDETVVQRLSQRERMVDPNLYPKIRGARGIFKVKPGNVANHLLVKRALAGEEQKVDKIKTADIADYLLQNALK